MIFKKLYTDKIKHLPSDNKCVLWCKINKEVASIDKDIILGSVYVPPENSKYFTPDILEDLELEIIEKQAQDDIYMCLGGDFNARTGTLNDLLINSEEPEFGCPDYFKKDCKIQSQRENCDKKTNNLGYSLVNLCSSTNLYIINGRTSGDTEGDYTFKSTSTLDYFICSFDLVDIIKCFNVLPFNPLFSDGHSPISMELYKDLPPIDPSQVETMCNANQADKNSNVSPSKKINWDRTKSTLFSELLREDSRWSELDIASAENRSPIAVNQLVEHVCKIFVDCADKCGMVKVCFPNHCETRQPKKSKKFKWFNEECKNARTEYEVSKHRYHALKNENNLTNMKNKSKLYKMAINRAKQADERAFAENLRRLQSNDPKKFWSLINERSGPDKLQEAPSIQEFFTHFAALYHTDEDVSFDDSVLGELENSGVNEPFTTREVLKGIKALKNNKAPGGDNITNEMLKNVPFNVLNIITGIFNIILDTGNVPTSWASGSIKPIYKNKGDKKNVDNYRAITLVSCFGKLFTSLLNRRLTEMLESNNVISEAQAGFRAGHSTIDHIFALKAIIELYLAQGRKLYCAFVDYRKAFDTVSRTILWRKILAQGISGKIFNVIKNLYESAKSCINFNGEVSDYFESKVGVKQGENLSPLLFALFLNDIEGFFTENGGARLGFMEKLFENALPDELLWLKFFILLYADDTIILAENEEDLQHQLDALYKYCQENNLTVNDTKTKVMVFARSKARLRNTPNFRYGEKILEIVENYTYLGIVFTWNGKFDKARRELAKKATRAMFAIIQKGRKLKLEIDIMIKLFDTCVVPILLYGSEIWGYESVEILERVHTRFCKILLKCSKFVHNSMIYAELGRYPLYLEINRRMLNFWSRLLLGSNRKFSSVMYRILWYLNDNERHVSPWINHIQVLLQNTGFNFFWLSQQVPNILYVGSVVKRLLQDQFLQSWCEKIDTNPDFIMYRIFKNNLVQEKYLSILPEHLRQPLTEFRTGSYRIPVNNRRLELPRNERKCSYCDRNVLGDEFHFLLECRTFENIRNKYIPAQFVTHPNTLKMKYLLQNEALIFHVARFIFESFRQL